MKNIITTLFLTFIISTQLCGAESEPEAINAKDLMDKVDRSEISTEDSSPELDNTIPEFEIPKIEFEQTNTTKTKQTKNTVAKSTSTKNNVVFAKRPIGLVQLLRNDKIVLSNAQTYVYRLSNKTITQYKLKDKVPVNSKGLKKSSKNSFYVVNVSLLKKDAKNLDNNNKPKVTKATKPKINTPKVELADKAPIQQKPDSDIAAKRKLLEGKLNHGKSISKTIKLKSLQTNDEIVISGGVQLVIRKKKSTSGVKKYWLIEKLDLNNDAVVEKSKNVYKLIKPYR